MRRLGRRRADQGEADPRLPLTLGTFLPVHEVPPRGGRPREIPEYWRTIPRRLWQYQPRPRRILLGRPAQGVAGLELLTGPGAFASRKTGRSLAASVALHVALAAWISTAPIGFGLPPSEPEQLALRLGPPVKLVAPPPGLVSELTGGGAPAVREVTLESLLAEPGEAPAAPEPSDVARIVVPPPPIPPPEVEAPLVSIPEPPPPVPAAEAPPPPPEETTPEEPAAAEAGEESDRPLLAFEKPGAVSLPVPVPKPTTGLSRPGEDAGALIPKPPSSTVERAVAEISRAGGGRGMVLGDVAAPGGVLEARGMPPSRGGAASNIQLLSDPKGVDFRPYLIQVLAAVRRNWYAVLPASAKLGRRGRVVIQLAIDRSGNVPKLVIAIPSGAEPLDRAAVAAISASNPFPPLPAEYTGEEIRLQLNFLYNLKR